jgi:hypothetical protein
MEKGKKVWYGKGSGLLTECNCLGAAKVVTVHWPEINEHWDMDGGVGLVNRARRSRLCRSGPPALRFAPVLAIGPPDGPLSLLLRQSRSLSVRPNRARVVGGLFNASQPRTVGLM